MAWDICTGAQHLATLVFEANCTTDKAQIIDICRLASRRGLRIDRNLTKTGG